MDEAEINVRMKCSNIFTCFRMVMKNRMFAKTSDAQLQLPMNLLKTKNLALQDFKDRYEQAQDWKTAIDCGACRNYSIPS